MTISAALNHYLQDVYTFHLPVGMKTVHLNTTKCGFERWLRRSRRNSDQDRGIRMGILDFFKSADINEGVKQFRSDKNAVLLDVRSEEEYAAGHIPGSINIPLDRIGEAAGQIPDKKTAVFVYCLRGARSRRAARALSKMGYEDARSIGGINNYTGKTER